ncbi:MAG: CoB--CoM heterodisulfide reductase iron-sulfur subunit A family protein [Armatimonadetes bacterium]|nr:CoB--CoM heterodisulfide reductase iron-sulfur subunit A family protein [Armatimonadota bacterium]
MKADALVIGAGIAGMQAALDLADQGLRVVLAESRPSIGGKMIALSKVFPTLDCASCITTPKMAAVANHENIEMLTYTDVLAVRREGDRFRAALRKKPRFVDPAKCTGCRDCEYVCPVDLPHEYEEQLGARKAIYVPFATAVPQIAVLDLENCIACGRCYDACPPRAVDYTQEAEDLDLEVATVIVATSFELTDVGAKEQYGSGKFPNVISALQMERLLAPHGPFGGVLRPSDGKEPDSIAYVLCAGSRDRSLPFPELVPYCSRVCCMYSIKQAMLLSGALPLADITIYFMDIRAFGKGYEQFYQNAKAMGINFIKGKVAKITEKEDGNLTLLVEHMEETGEVSEDEHDLVVLAPGIIPSHLMGLPRPVELPTDEYGFFQQPQMKTDPMLSQEEGVFFAGTALGPKDIVDTIAEASAAAAKAADYLVRVGVAASAASSEG